MADISKIILPDNSTYNIKDSRITSTDINNWNTKEIFICTYNTTTYEEITTALNAGKIPICFVGNEITGFGFNNQLFIFADYNANENYYFMSVIGANAYWLGCGTGSGWFINSKNYESRDRMVTSITSSSTNSQYPTAKSVYDTVYNMTHYVKGDTLSLNGESCAAFITTSLKQIYIFIPTSKDASGLTWTATTFTGAIRTGAGGYLSDGTTASNSSDWVNSSNKTEIACFGKVNGIEVRITGTAAWSGGNVVNNMALNFFTNSVILTAS